jgi:hypothetical protein
MRMASENKWQKIKITNDILYFKPRGEWRDSLQAEKNRMEKPQSY